MTCIDMADILKGEIWTVLSDIWQRSELCMKHEFRQWEKMREMMRIDMMNEWNLKIHSAQKEHDSFHLNYFRGQLNHRIQKLLKVRESLREKSLWHQKVNAIRNCGNIWSCMRKNNCGCDFWPKNEKKFKMVFQYPKLWFGPHTNSCMINQLQKESLQIVDPF